MGKFKVVEKFVSIKVQDHGIGIKTEDLNKIFEKFVRVENHLTSKAQGSGLGLYIVKSLIEKMGGEIHVKSSTKLPESGSTFELSPISCSGIEECRVALIRASKGMLPHNFIEGMACKDGCIGGAGCLSHGEKNRKKIDDYATSASKKVLTED